METILVDAVDPRMSARYSEAYFLGLGWCHQPRIRVRGS